jgi:hypothetical protein
MRGALPDPVAIQQLLQLVRYDSVTRRVSVELRDGSRFEYLLSLPVRPGVRSSEQEGKLGGRTPHVSRLMALAIKFQSLVSSGSVRNYRELAEVRHVSRPRLSQIMKLAQLAPGIQEKLLFLPPTLEGPDRVFEKHLRFLASVVDWEKQKELFHAFEGRTSHTRSLPVGDDAEDLHRLHPKSKSGYSHQIHGAGCFPNKSSTTTTY